MYFLTPDSPEKVLVCNESFKVRIDIGHQIVTFKIKTREIQRPAITLVSSLAP